MAKRRRVGQRRGSAASREEREEEMAESVKAAHWREEGRGLL